MSPSLKAGEISRLMQNEKRWLEQARLRLVRATAARLATGSVPEPRRSEESR